MNKSHLTEWIDGDVKPTLPGVYQKLCCGYVVYAYWNGEFWGMFTGPKSTPEDALEDAHCRSFAQRAKWRGFAEDPNQAPAQSRAPSRARAAPGTARKGVRHERQQGMP